MPYYTYKVFFSTPPAQLGSTLDSAVTLDNFSTSLYCLCTNEIIMS